MIQIDIISYANISLWAFVLFIACFMLLSIYSLLIFYLIKFEGIKVILLKCIHFKGMFFFLAFCGNFKFNVKPFSFYFINYCRHRIRIATSKSVDFLFRILRACYSILFFKIKYTFNAIFFFMKTINKDNCPICILQESGASLPNYITGDFNDWEAKFFWKPGDEYYYFVEYGRDEMNRAINLIKWLSDYRLEKIVHDDSFIVHYFYVFNKEPDDYHPSIILGDPQWELIDKFDARNYEAHQSFIARCLHNFSKYISYLENEGSAAYMFSFLTIVVISFAIFLYWAYVGINGYSLKTGVLWVKEVFKLFLKCKYLFNKKCDKIFFKVMWEIRYLKKKYNLWRGSHEIKKWVVRNRWTSKVILLYRKYLKKH